MRRARTVAEIVLRNKRTGRGVVVGEIADDIAIVAVGRGVLRRFAGPHRRRAVSGAHQFDVEALLQFLAGTRDAAAVDLHSAIVVGLKTASDMRSEPIRRRRLGAIDPAQNPPDEDLAGGQRRLPHRGMRATSVPAVTVSAPVSRLTLT